MESYIENIPALPVVYMRRTGPYGEQNYKLMQDMKQWIACHNLWNEKGIIYGIAQDNIATVPPEQCRYDVCFVTDSTSEDNKILHGTLPAGEYLVYKVFHTADEVQRFYATLSSALAKESRLIDEKRPILERYQFGLVEKGYCEFCVPVL